MLTRFFVFCVLAVTVNQAGAAERFDLTCSPVDGYAFRSSEDINGRKMPDEWTKETGLPVIRISYPGSGEVALIDGKQNMAIVEDQNLIILEYSSNGQAQSLWSYAVNLKLREVTAAQVNSAVVFGMGSLKSRAIQLRCN